MKKQKKTEQNDLSYTGNSKCMICGSKGAVSYSELDDPLFGAKGTWSFVKCPECGLLWLDPKPGPGELDSFYENYYTHEDVDINVWYRRILWRGVPAVIKGYRDIIKNRSVLFWGFIFAAIGPLREVGLRMVMWLPAKRRGRILDVGCGSGIFLRLMQSLGWEVYGLDPDPKAVETARAALKTDRVQTGFIEDSTFKECTFDVITMSHVVEHLLYPVETLKEARRLLKPGGLLVIATPNSRSLGLKRFGKLWRGLEPPRHINIFNPDTLVHVIEKAGFAIRSVSTPASTTYITWQNSLLLKKKVLKQERKIPPITTGMKIISMFYWGVVYFLTRFGAQCGEEVFITAEREK